MKRCHFCAGDIPEGASFCSFCGKRVQAASSGELPISKTSKYLFLTLLGLAAFVGLISVVSNLVPSPKPMYTEVLPSPTSTPFPTPTPKPTLTPTRAERRAARREARRLAREAEKQRELQKQRDDEVAAAPEPAAEKSDVDRFLEKTSSANDEYVDSAELASSIFDDTEKSIRVTVKDSFHYLPYQVRFQYVQGWWAVWASVHSAKGSAADRYGVQAVDGMGNQIGWSMPPGGSLIHVND